MQTGAELHDRYTGVRMRVLYVQLEYCPPEFSQPHRRPSASVLVAAETGRQAEMATKTGSSRQEQL